MSKLNIDTGEFKNKIDSLNEKQIDKNVFTLGKLQFYVFITFILTFFVHTFAEILQVLHIISSNGYLFIIWGYMLSGLAFMNYKFSLYRKETKKIFETTIEILENELK
jgi:hypothetical protein